MARYNRFMGEYNENTTYEKGDVVTFDGAAYYRKMPGIGISPIARKKPYTVWSRLNEDLSTIFPLGGTGTGLPSDVGAYKYMATDGEGKWVPVDRLAWKEGEKVEITWDGNTEGLVNANNYFYKVSDLVLDNNTIEAGTIVIDGNTFALETILDYFIVTDDCVIVGEGLAFARKENASAEGLVFPEAGVYFSSTCTSFTSVTETIHPIPAEYITGAPLTDADNGKVVGVVDGALGLVDAPSADSAYVYAECEDDTFMSISVDKSPAQYPISIIVGGLDGKFDLYCESTGEKMRCISFSEPGDGNAYYTFIRAKTGTPLTLVALNGSGTLVPFEE